MMRRLAFLLGLTLSGPVLADSVLPRLSPLPLVAEDGGDAGAAPVAFGQPLEVLAREGAVLTVQDGAGQSMRVRAADVLAEPREGLVLRPSAALAGADTGRSDLPLWDSGLRGRAYLGGTVAGAMAPPLLIPSASDLTGPDLPVVAVDRVATSVGEAVTLVGALVPVRIGALDPQGGAARAVMLHVLVDGSAASRSFTLDTLRRLSRAIAEGQGGLDGASRFSRQVVFESGALRDEGEVPASGLRAEWPDEAGQGDPAGLAGALAQAVEQLADGIDPADGTAHVVLLLPGPGLSDDGPALAAVEAAGQRLSALRAAGADLRGVVLVQGTPEPNPVNEAVLARLSGGAETRLLGFGEDPAPALAELMSAPASGDADVDPTALCSDAAAAGLPCILPAPDVLPAGITRSLAGQGQADWVALPLWLVAEAAPFDLVPPGMAAADAHAVQAEIRACHSAGQAWDAAAGCGPRRDPDADALGDRIEGLQAEIGVLADERDAATATLAQRDVEWQAERADLGMRLTATEGERDTALADVARHAETIASQSAELDDHRQTVAAQADRLELLSAEVATLQADLQAASQRGDALFTELDQRSADLQAATARIEALDRERADIAETLQQEQDRVAALTAEVGTLTQSLDEMTAAKATAEAQSGALAAQLAAAQTAVEGLTAKRDELADQLAAAEARLTEAGQALAAAQAAQDARIAALTADLDRETARAEGLDGALATAKSEHEARVAALEADLGTETARAEGLDGALATAKSEHEARVAALEAELGTETARAEGLDGALATAKSEHEARIAALEAELGTEKARAEGLDGALDTARSEHEARVAALEAERAKAVARAQAAEDQLATATARVAEVEALSQNLSRAGDGSSEQLSLLSENLLEEGRKREALQAEIAGLKADLAALTTERDRLTAAGAEAARQLAAVQADRDSLATRATALAAEAVAARDELATGLTTAGGEADRRLAEAQSQRDDLAARVTALDAELATAQTARDGMAARVSDLEAELALARDALAAGLTVAGEEADRQLAEVQTQRDGMAARVSDLEAELALARDALAAAAEADHQLADVQAERDVLAAKVAALEAAAAATGDQGARLAEAEAEILRLQTAMAAPAATVTETLAAAAPVRRPKPRPAPAPAGTPKPAPAKTEDGSGGLAVLSAPQPAMPAVASKRVAPSQQAPRLNGCQFQWVGQEGRLVCP